MKSRFRGIRITSPEKAYQTILNEIKRGREDYSEIINDNGDSLFIVDVNTRNILETNLSFQQLLGYTSEEIKSLKLYDLIAHDRAYVDRKIHLIFHTKKSYLGKWRFRTKNGDLLDLEIKIFLGESVSSRLLCVIPSDVLEREGVKSKLQESEKKYRLITENANDIIAILNSNYEIEYMNAAPAKKFMGYSVEELLGKNSMDFIHLNDREVALRDGFISNGVIKEVRLKIKDGSYCWFEFKGRTFLDNRNQRKNIVVLRDITDRKKVETELKQSEEKYRHLFENSPNSLILINKNGIIVDCNSITKQNLGIDKSDLIGKSFQELSKIFCPEDLPLLADLFKSFLYGIIPKPLELRIHKLDGTSIWLSIKISIFEIETEKFILSIIRNITERKLAEQRLRESEERYRLITENVNDLIFVVNKNNDFEFINQKAHERIMGYTREDLLEMKGRLFIHPDDVELALRSMKEGFEKGEASAEVRIKHKTGHYLWFELKGKIFIDKDGERKGIIVSRDITKRKELERLRDDFFESISHELRTPLIAIRGFVELLLKSDNLYDMQITDLQNILKNEERLERLIDEIISYSLLKSGLIQLNRDTFYLSEIISEVKEGLNFLITKKNLSFEISLEPNEYLNLDRVQITKVIRNLIENAVKYSFPNGIIYIKSLTTTKSWTFAIQDRGIGISQENISKLFKRHIKFEDAARIDVSGIGIGLAIVKKIIDSYEGKIWVTSDGINKGTTVTFRIDLN